MTKNVTENIKSLKVPKWELGPDKENICRLKNTENQTITDKGEILRLVDFLQGIVQNFHYIKFCV